VPGTHPGVPRPSSTCPASSWQARDQSAGPPRKAAAAPAPASASRAGSARAAARLCPTRPASGDTRQRLRLRPSPRGPCRSWRRPPRFRPGGASSTRQRCRAQSTRSPPGASGVGPAVTSPTPGALLLLGLALPRPGCPPASWAPGPLVTPAAGASASCARRPRAAGSNAREAPGGRAARTDGWLGAARSGPGSAPPCSRRPAPAPALHLTVSRQPGQYRKTRPSNQGADPNTPLGGRSRWMHPS